jgi:hypothetical protein
MLSNADEELTVDQVRALLGPPPLMLGESEEEYWKWWMAIVEPGKPKSFRAWLEVDELAYKEWEQRGLRRYRPALVKKAWISALQSLLDPIHDGVSAAVAEAYFGNDAKKQKAARETVRKYGITEEQIVAEGLAKRGDEMLILDRMDSNRANASRHLRKAIDRRAETDKIPPEQTRDQALGVQDLGNREADSG